MSLTRKIDLLPAKPRTNEVKILVLGFSRTGTFSLKTALEKLGYSPYHMSVALRSRREGHLAFWEEALRAKFLGDGKPFGRVEFDKFLGRFDVLEDIPSILFADELLQAYPDAKVILTNRAVEPWLASMNATFFTKLWGPYTRILRIIMTHWGRGNPSDRAALRQTYLDHYAHIRSVVPQSRLLEFESRQGWKPLCEFLGKETPNEEYPRSNDAASTVKIHGFLYWVRLVKVVWMPSLAWSRPILFFSASLLSLIQSSV
ncbi:P-loop containing nucleoside triphosphate hydrolase protein [Phaeosphaeriaceae sp. PMI808]|nr:P-loop containing nucleoside triphosphate hydrolase protein [Phaeosphaeriaceae sp. PMI808]